MSLLADKLYAVTDKGPLRALSLAMALVLAGCVFWQPAQFASSTSKLEVWHGIILIWAVCTGLIHGFGFRPPVCMESVLFPLTGDDYPARRASLLF